jgi:hypothetical protein
MPITLTTKVSAQLTETVALPAGKILRVTIDGVEQTDYTLTNTTAAPLQVLVQVKVVPQ